MRDEPLRKRLLLPVEVLHHRVVDVRVHARDLNEHASGHFVLLPALLPAGSLREQLRKPRERRLRGRLSQGNGLLSERRYRGRSLRVGRLAAGPVARVEARPLLLLRDPQPYGALADEGDEERGQTADADRDT